MSDPTVVAAARVRAPVAPLHAEPLVSSAQSTQALAGHLLDVLEERDDWWRARGADGYEGWVHRGFVERVTAARRRAGGWGLAPPDAVVSLGCVVRGATGRCRALPLGALLDPDERAEEGEALPTAELRRRFPRERRALARTAVARFEGTSYQWGGVTPWGADCSGLVQTAFSLHGVALPRDAWQQATEGDDAGRDLSALAPADLLFFSDRPDRRITHVGIALAERRMVHLALGRGGYAVERLDDEGDPYVATLIERFCFARRIGGMEG